MITIKSGLPVGIQFAFISGPSRKPNNIECNRRVVVVNAANLESTFRRHSNKTSLCTCHEGPLPI